MYARIRAHERNLLTTNLLYNIPKSSSIISPTPFTSIIQSPYNPYPYWHHIGCDICTNCQHLSSFVTHLPSIINHYPTIRQLFIIHSIICQSPPHLLSLSPIISHASYFIFIQFPVQLAISSICQSAIKPCQFSIYLPHSHIHQFLILYR